MSAMIIYHEHHIIPKHIFKNHKHLVPSNLKLNSKENLIKLTVKQHAKAHKKLYEQFAFIEDYVAWKCLLGSISTEQARLIIIKGNKYRLNKFHNNETKLKMSLSKLGKKFSKQHKQNISKSLTGKKQPNVSLSKSGNWLITTPGGSKLKITNLKQFCSIHKLDRGHMWSVAKGKRKHHKGYKCNYA